MPSTKEIRYRVSVGYIVLYGEEKIEMVISLKIDEVVWKTPRGQGWTQL